VRQGRGRCVCPEPSVELGLYIFGLDIEHKYKRSMACANTRTDRFAPAGRRPNKVILQVFTFTFPVEPIVILMLGPLVLEFRKDAGP